MRTNKLKIGEFSRLCKVTVRTLRYYEKIGLLVPEIVDQWTGYRYYAVSQIQKMMDVLELKRLGFNLEEIKSLFDNTSHKPGIDALEEKIHECESMLQMLQTRKSQLKAMIASQKKLDKMKTIFIDSLPEVTVASYKGIIPSYDALGKLCCETIGPEMARLGCECPEPGYSFTVEHGGYKPANIDIEYCEKVTEAKKDSDLIKFKTIPAAPTAVCMKAYGPYGRLLNHYQDLFAWIEKEGWRISGEPRAVYIDGIWNQDDPEKWLTVIQVPAEK